MRYFYLFYLSLFSITSFGSHLIGGNITWECLGTNQYVFTLSLYKDCANATAPLLNSYAIDGPAGPIIVVRDTIIDMTITCTGPTSKNCDSTNPNGVQLHRYNSVVQTLVGTPPSSGWVFSFEECCRTFAIVNIAQPAGAGIFIRSVMYNSLGAHNNSSPYFDFNPAQQIISINNSLSTLAQTSNPSDSIYYDFTNPFVDSATSVSFLPGYSLSNPFPNSATNSLNGNVSINHYNGLIDFDIQSGTSGLYTYAVKVEQWRDGALLSEIIVDNSVRGDFVSTSNMAPVVSIDTAIYEVTQVGNTYKISALPGDTVYFEMNAQDSDSNSSTGQYQVIQFKASGYALDSTWNEGNSFVNDALLIPVAPQSGFTNSLINKVRFIWPVEVEHFAGARTNHAFHFQFADDECPYVGMSHIIVEVNIKSGAFIKADTVIICGGDSVILNGITASSQFKWFPATSISSDTVANPIVSPQASRYYYLTDPQNPGFKDSVYVDVTPRDSFSLSFGNGILTLIDSALTTSRTWYHNGIPFAYPYDTLTPFGLGDYYAIGKAGACEFLSDTVAIDTGMSFAVSSTGNGAYSGSPVLFTGSLGTTVQVNQSVYITSVAIAGISDLYGKTGGYDLKLQVYDDMQNQVFLRDTTLAKPMKGLVILPFNNLKLKANTDYTFSVSGDTGYAFSVFENVSLPATPHNAGLTVKSISEGNHGQFPSGSTNYMLPLSMGINRGIGISELHQQSFDIFPNPASSELTISGFAGVNTIELLDVNGKIIRSFLVKKNQKELKIEKAGLPAGLYFVKVYSGNTTAVKKVLFQ